MLTFHSFVFVIDEICEGWHRILLLVVEKKQSLVYHL